MAGKGRDISRRIKAVNSIQQVTSAMKLVAAANLRRAQERVIAARPYASQLEAILHRLAGTGAIDHPLFEVRERKRVAYVVMASDRGLCGSYNINLIRKSAQVLREETAEPMLIAIGRRVRDFYTRRATPIAEEYIGLPEDPSYALAREMAASLMKLFLDRQVDEVRLIYTEFRSALSQSPAEIQLLPVQQPAAAAAAVAGVTEADATGDEADIASEEPAEDYGWSAADGPWKAPYIFEPDANSVLGSLLPKYVETQVYRVLLEAKASEHGARMTAMSTATENASEMIDKLTLLFNRARQAAITQEISEIVGGAEALK